MIANIMIGSFIIVTLVLITPNLTMIMIQLWDEMFDFLKRRGKI